MGINMMFHLQNRRTSIIVPITYGYLYNGYIFDGFASGSLINDLHVPSDSEFTTLSTYLGGVSVAGGKMKETGLDHWLTPNTGATNSSGFTGIGGGYRRYSDGLYTLLKNQGYYWTSTHYSSTNLFHRNLNYNDDNLSTFSFGQSKKYGFSIRCMRDLTTQEQTDYSDGDVVETKTDYDGNNYNVIRTGTQGWTQTNLKTTHYLTGASMTKVTDATTWAAKTSEAYCSYGNNDGNIYKNN